MNYKIDIDIPDNGDCSKCRANIGKQDPWDMNETVDYCFMWGSNTNECLEFRKEEKQMKETSVKDLEMIINNLEAEIRCRERLEISLSLVIKELAKHTRIDVSRLRYDIVIKVAEDTDGMSYDEICRYGKAQQA